MATDAVQAAVDARRQQITEQAAWSIAAIEAKRDAELAELTVDEAPAPAADPAPKPRPKHRQGRRQPKGTTSPQAALKRRDDLFKYIAEKGKVGVGEIRADLGFSEGQARTALTRLLDEDRIIKTGERQFTRYEVNPNADQTPAAAGRSAAAAGGSPPAPTAPGTGTLQGRILAAIDAGDNFATLAALMEATGQGEDEVRGACGVLIREEEIRMERRGEQSGYVREKGGI